MFLNYSKVHGWMDGWMVITYWIQKRDGSKPAEILADPRKRDPGSSRYSKVCFGKEWSKSCGRFHLSNNTIFGLSSTRVGLPSPPHHCLTMM